MIARILPAFALILSLSLANLGALFGRSRRRKAAAAVGGLLLVSTVGLFVGYGSNQAGAAALREHYPAAADLTRMGIRRPPFIRFLSRSNLVNIYLGMLRASLERKLLGRRAC